MKKMKVKLALNKKKIANLNDIEAKKIKGGRSRMTCNLTATIGGISSTCQDTGEIIHSRGTW